MRKEAVWVVWAAGVMEIAVSLDRRGHLTLAVVEVEETQMLELALVEVTTEAQALSSSLTSQVQWSVQAEQSQPMAATPFTHSRRRAYSQGFHNE
jgi:hypothetical protein